jgi:hypothetical protein
MLEIAGESQEVFKPSYPETRKTDMRFCRSSAIFGINGIIGKELLFYIVKGSADWLSKGHSALRLRRLDDVLMRVIGSSRLLLLRRIRLCSAVDHSVRPECGQSVKVGLARDPECLDEGAGHLKLAPTYCRLLRGDSTL